jgi:hypothetical protein
LLRRLAPLGIAACALAFPAAASAGTLTTPHPCGEQGEFASISGSGFSPEISLSFTGEKGEASTLPDESGVFSNALVGMPDSGSYVPKTVTINTVDQVNAANNTSIQLMYVKYGSNLPVGGKHGAIVTWQFAGFPTGATIWLHFRRAHNGPFRTIKDIKLGQAAGPCGTLRKRMARVPVKNPPRGGDWFVQADTKARYSSNTNTYYWYKSFNLR